MAERIPVDAILPPCHMEVTLQEDGTSVALSSLDSDIFVFEETKHPNKLLEGLNSLRLSNTFCDVILCCGRQEFPCHRNVLASFSSYFQAMFTTEWMESQQMRVAISGVEPQIMDMLVTYGYTSKVAISAENVQALLKASDLLNVAAVQEACWQYMERHMDENNCVGIHLFAEAHCRQTLQKRSMDCILQHFSMVHQQQEFFSLSVEKLSEILSSDDVNVSGEELVFEAAMLWLEKCPTRKQSIAKVLELIRLPLISSSYLHDVIECVDVVKESQGCQRLISEAKTDQHLLPYGLRAQPRWSTVGEVMVVIAETYGEQGSTFSFESFDPRTTQWRTLGRPPFNLRRYSLVVSGSDLYVAVGDREMWRYDRSSDSWMEIAPMHEAHYSCRLVMLDGFVYAVPGHAFAVPDHRLNRCALPSIERYDPNTNTWQLMEFVTMPIDYNLLQSAVVALDGRIHFIGGGSAGSFYSYNPQTLVWTEGTPFAKPTSRPAVCTLNGKIYVIGGYLMESRSETNAVTCYNPETDQWTTRAHMNFQRLSPGVAVLDGKIYVLGGYSERRKFRTIERYCEETDTWEIVGEMPTKYSFLRCVSFKLRTDANMANRYATADAVPTV